MTTDDYFGDKLEEHDKLKKAERIAEDLKRIKKIDEDLEKLRRNSLKSLRLSNGQSSMGKDLETEVILGLSLVQDIQPIIIKLLEDNRKLIINSLP